MNSSVLSSLAVFLYLGGGFLLARRLVHDPREPVLSKLPALLLGLFAVMLHGWLLEQSIAGENGLILGFSNAVSLLAGTIVLVLLLVAAFRPVENLGIVILPLAAVGIVIAQWAPDAGRRVSLSEPGLELHIILSVVAYALLTIAAMQAVLLAIQESHLRRRRPGGLIRQLPPMQTMEQLLFQMLSLGFVLLTLSLLSGFLFIEDLFAQHLVHKTALSLVAWSVFALLLWGRWRFGWRGRTAIRWTLAGFVFLMLAYLGSKVVLELILGRV